MRLLLDTHSFLWFISGSSLLSTRAKSHLEDFENELWISIGSLWEVAIKANLGKLILSEPYDVLIPKELERHEIHLLEIRMDHLKKVVHLPSHHRDPFDRLIAAQSIVEQTPIVSADEKLSLYGVDRIW